MRDENRKHDVAPRERILVTTVLQALFILDLSFTA
jgi:hypothetical protein